MFATGAEKLIPPTQGRSSNPPFSIDIEDSVQACVTQAMLLD